MDATEIKALRKALGLSQERMAQAIGVSFMAVSRWERGLAKPSRLAMEKLGQLKRREQANAPFADIPDVLVPKEEILLPYPEDADISDEGRSSLALARDLRRIHDYVKQERPDWEMIEASIVTVIKDGKRYFLVTKIMNATP